MQIYWYVEWRKLVSEACFFLSFVRRRKVWDLLSIWLETKPAFVLLLSIADLKKNIMTKWCGENENKRTQKNTFDASSVRLSIGRPKRCFPWDFDLVFFLLSIATSSWYQSIVIPLAVFCRTSFFHCQTEANKCINSYIYKTFHDPVSGCLHSKSFYWLKDANNNTKKKIAESRELTSILLCNITNGLWCCWVRSSYPRRRLSPDAPGAFKWCPGPPKLDILHGKKFCPFRLCLQRKAKRKKNKRNQSKESTKRSARLISWQHGSIAKKTYYNIICIYVWYSLIIKRVLFGCYTTQQHNNDDILMMLLLSDKWISMWHRLLPYWILCLCIAFARQQIKYPLSQQQKKKEKNIWE